MSPSSDHMVDGHGTLEKTTQQLGAVERLVVDWPRGHRRERPVIKCDAGLVRDGRRVPDALSRRVGIVDGAGPAARAIPATRVDAHVSASTDGPVTRRVEKFNGSRKVEDDDPRIVALAVNESRFLKDLRQHRRNCPRPSSSVKNRAALVSRRIRVVVEATLGGTKMAKLIPCTRILPRPAVDACEPRARWAGLENGIYGKPDWRGRQFFHVPRRSEVLR